MTIRFELVQAGFVLLTTMTDNHGCDKFMLETGQTDLDRLMTSKHISTKTAVGDEGVTCSSDAQCKTVLIVDDDQHLVASISDALRIEGYDVLTALNGNVGLAIALVKNPDLIILDLMMPIRSGFLVLEKLRETSVLDCPIVVLSDTDGKRHREYAEMLGVSEYLIKPFATNELVAIVSQTLERSFATQGE